MDFTLTPVIEIAGLNKWYGDFHVLRDIELDVWKGERIVICGPSGSGKSTLIRCINRLEVHQKGKIVVDGTELTDDLKRIDEVLDCWFESGSMPYAQVHYPFERRKEFEEGFPADFIAEGKTFLDG